MPTDDPALATLSPARPERRFRATLLEPGRFAVLCLAIYAGCWLLAAVEPYHRRDWLLENLLAFAAVPYLVVQQWRRPFRPGTNALLLIFLCLHAVGAHFTYAEVPYDAWAQKLVGGTISDVFHWNRNHFDRLVHFAYGALVVPAAKELYARHMVAGELTLNLIAVQFIIATSAAYELIEWGAALVVDQDLGMAYLGIQGDVWDAHKDVLLASVGAIVSVVAVSVRRGRRAHGRSSG
ncbi:MAG TPA: DUF2238 domain-containing protein [Stenotrophomonas sp.]|uniref:DUF2238 domain-containing protein n=1 Tax=Stenotrophomonas TaxID=40323 RepID=UPI000E7ED6FD|nr:MULTISPECIES: DUF2238 domain-containing protein [Stenotrophomonas]HBS61336.1 DUF2238 domain-containing protein [Stenotrophomonas sp.]